ncbi:mobilization protein [Limnohabitans sp. TS-CS-82]|uniref:mobilization protein n=1 Tax=Limnohabitans sp. TS-CS-82 TaxID=2094193 RepID=UPI000CF2CBEE|nr:mobilization protein [Limnohabitans sp. TS-CS-82]PQA83136.1 mobilization protein [Limnohabitans sp. TS-CS-82]
MSSLNFIGGEKGGVGKSVVSRVLAQYFIDKRLPFTGFDTDRSHTSFTRFYADFASPIIVDNYEGLDAIGAAFEDTVDGAPPSVIVDLAAQTAAPLTRWIKDSDLFNVMADLGVTVNFWHIADAGKDSVDLLDTLIDTFGHDTNYVVVKNQGRGTDFSQLEASDALKKAMQYGARVVTLGQLQETSMRKIDRQNASFWAALNHHSGTDGLGLLERQRVKNWLKKTYETFDTLPL